MTLSQLGNDNYNVAFVIDPKENTRKPAKFRQRRTQCWVQKYFVLFLTSWMLFLVLFLFCPQKVNCDTAVPPLLGVNSGISQNADETLHRNLLYSFAPAGVNADDASAFIASDYKNSLSGASGRHLTALGYSGKKIKAQKFYSHTPFVSSDDHSPLQYRALLHPQFQAAKHINNDLTSWNLLDETSSRIDICTVCQCNHAKNPFATITCDFQQNRRLSEIFGANYRVPQEATSITIKLAAETHFRLEQGFFTNNTVNSLIIEGARRDGEQVEITTGAFYGNNGPYPELQMLNVFSVVVREKAFAGNGKFTVRNSNDLILYSNAFENAKINGFFLGIKDLRIEEKAFNSGQARLRIEASYIENIYRLEASLSEIRFVNCTIGTINSGTFDVININYIVFEDCRIDVIKTRAITEKLYSQHISITGAIIGSIEGEAIYGSGISELILTKNKIETIHKNAIYVTAINATISQNHIKHLGNNWLRIKEWSHIIIEKNSFGDFGTIRLEETKQPLTCRFDGNSLTRPLPGSLNLPYPHCILHEIVVDKPCNCHLTWLHELSAHDLNSETYCTIDDKLGHCFNATSFNALKYLNEVCDDTKTIIDCVANRNLKKVDGKFFTPEELENRNNSIYLYAITAIAFLVVSVVTIILLVCYCKRRYANGPGGADYNGRHHQHKFSPDELHLMDSTLMVIQKKHPDINCRARKLVQKLKQENLPKDKCDNLIMKIENLMSKTDKCADFNNFSNLLVQHMQANLPDAPLCRTFTTHEASEGVHYAVSARVGADKDVDGNYQINEQNNILNEPFYEEVGHPLLDNGYASPADRRDYDSPNNHTADLNTGEYAEPVNNRAEPVQCIPPYATVTIRQLPSLPTISPAGRPRDDHDALPGYSNSSTSRPTASATLTNVQRIANDLQKKPNFHLGGQRPRNLPIVTRPVYTTPDVSHKRSATSRTTTPVPAPRLASPESVDSDLYAQSVAALPPDTGSDHSGGSKETVKIDDIIEYADA